MHDNLETVPYGTVTMYVSIIQ